MLELLLHAGKSETPAKPGEYRHIRLAMLRGPMYVTIDKVQVREKSSNTDWTKLAGTTTSANSVYPGYSTQGVIGTTMGVVAQMWCPANGLADPNRGTWWQVTFTQPRYVDSVLIACSLGFGREPQDIAVMGSNDGLIWEDLVVRTNLTWQHQVFQEML